MKYQIVKEEMVFNDFFKIKKATIKHELFNHESIEVDRLCFERGDAVAILIYEKDTDTLLFTKQFRYPSIKEEDGWLIEITAGMLEMDENPIDRVKLEVEEEIGYQLQEVAFINSSFVSPGGTSERIFLYYAEVDSHQKIYEGGGVLSESEDIQLIKLSPKEVKSMYRNNQFRDMKTVLAIQWFLLNKA